MVQFKLPQNSKITVGKYFKKINYKTYFKILFLCLVGNVLGGFVLGFLFAGSSVINPNMAEYLGHMVAAKQAYILDGHYLDLFIRASKTHFTQFQNIRLAEQILFKAISNQEERIPNCFR